MTADVKGATDEDDDATAEDPKLDDGVETEVENSVCVLSIAAVPVTTVPLMVEVHVEVYTIVLAGLIVEVIF